MSTRASDGSGPAGLLRRRVADDPSRPLVTYYDDAAGERVELSARTFDNWVSKTANLLVDGLAAEPGTPVVLALPPHWQSAVWLMACWSAGLTATPADPAAVRAGTVEPPGDSGPYLLAAAEEVLDEVVTGELGAAAAEEIVGLSLHALGGPLAHCPPGVVDYATEVRTHGDRFTALPGADQHPALSVTKATFSGTELVDAARAAAEKWEIDARDRVLVDMSFTTLDGVLAGLLAPLASGASVIIQRNFDKAALDRRVSVEHVTAVAGLTGWNDASGSLRRLT
ncbi:TIGR03089 family protein [Actinomadura roseirufa]|uniref:TIGR03089 family protein n=1 Tax=Actinomadura roseirufa TaxID=2094049 RepID=UPI0010418C50|nr:TIGR03089 family protein [Actinomadura roseirufa]